MYLSSRTRTRTRSPRPSPKSTSSEALPVARRPSAASARLPATPLGSRILPTDGGSPPDLGRAVIEIGTQKAAGCISVLELELELDPPGRHRSRPRPRRSPLLDDGLRRGRLLSVPIRLIRVHPCLGVSRSPSMIRGRSIRWLLLIPSAFLAAAAAFLAGGAAAREAALPVETGVSQLFVDDLLIAEQHGVKRTLHPPRKDNGGNIPVVA